MKGLPLWNTLRQGSQFRMGERVRTYGDIVDDADYFQHFEDLIREEGERPGRLDEAVLAARNVTHFTPHNVQLWENIHDFAVEQMFFAHHQLAFVKEFLSSIDPLLEGARAAVLRDDYETARRLLLEYRRRFEPQRERMLTIIRNAHEAVAPIMCRLL